NLAANAVRYTSRGGVIIGCRRRGKALRIEVYDTGAGIPADQRQRIFDEFYQAGGKQRWGGGLGLGLAIVDRLSKLLEHRVELTSTVGQGSCFSVTVPTIPGRRVPVQPSRSGALPDIPEDKLVVVIDDEMLILEAMSGLLTDWGCRVLTGLTCSVALGELGAEKPPDLIICDYHFSDGTTGTEAIERLRDAFKATIPALLISGDTSPEQLRLVRAQGHLLLHKPISPMALRATVSQLLRATSAADRSPEPKIPAAL
ncbi:MAG: response regulator, partial [Acidobacteriota bacterium]|nr:response regulator [Acidobacteriota bacterium]